MTVAMFGPTSDWAGKKITREGEVFLVQGHGKISALAIMENDRRKHLIWVNDWATRLCRRARPEPSGAVKADGR